MIVSENFAHILADLQRTVEVLVKENRALKKEVEDVKKDLANTKVETINNKSSQVKAAVSTSNQKQLEALSASPLTPLESEMVRQALPLPQLKVMPLQLAGNDLIQNYQQASTKSAPIQLKVKVETSDEERQRKYQRMYQKLQENNIAMAAENELRQKALRNQKELAMQKYKEENNAISTISKLLDLGLQ